MNDLKDFLYKTFISSSESKPLGIAVQAIVHETSEARPNIEGRPLPKS